MMYLICKLTFLLAEFHMLISFNTKFDFLSFLLLESYPFKEISDTKFDFFIVLAAGKLPFLKKSLTIL